MFRRLDARTGAVRWETNVRGNAPKYFFHGDVFVAPDRVIASSDVDPGAGIEAGVHAFDRDSGRELWKYPAGRGVLGALIGSGSRVFSYTSTGDLIALSADSGKLEWRYSLGAGAWDSPAALGLRVFAGSNDGSVYSFDSENGHVEWQRKLGAPISTSLRTGESSIYAGTNDGLLHRIGVSNGEELASLKLDPALKPSTAPLVSQDAVFVLLADAGAEHRALVSVDPALRGVKWRRLAADRWTTTRVFATSKTIVLGTPSGEVTAYCKSDGSPAWSQKLSTVAIRAIGGTDDILFVGTPQGTLYAVRPPAACI